MIKTALTQTGLHFPCFYHSECKEPSALNVVESEDLILNIRICFHRKVSCGGFRYSILLTLLCSSALTLFTTAAPADPGLGVTPEINNDTGQNQNNQHAHTYSCYKYPHKPLALPGDDVFEVSVARGESPAHLHNTVALADSAPV